MTLCLSMKAGEFHPRPNLVECFQRFGYPLNTRMAQPVTLAQRDQELIAVATQAQATQESLVQKDEILL